MDPLSKGEVRRKDEQFPSLSVVETQTEAKEQTDLDGGMKSEYVYFFAFYALKNIDNL